jgi:hypothetical protein
MDRSEAVADVIHEKCGAVVVDVVRVWLLRAVVGKARAEAGLHEAIDVGCCRSSERDADASCDRLLIVGRCEGEVPPGREGGRAPGLLDLELVERCREGAAGGCEVGDAEADVIEHAAKLPGTAIPHSPCVLWYGRRGSVPAPAVLRARLQPSAGAAPTMSSRRLARPWGAWDVARSKRPRRALVAHASKARKGKERMASSSHPSSPGVAPLDRPPIWAWPLAILVGFPIGGLVANSVVGPVDRVVAAVACGLLAGALIGGAQWLALRQLVSWIWIAATSVGMAAGLAVGAALVDYGIGRGDLVLMGAVTGVGVGVMQAVVLARQRIPGAAWWAVANPPAWALGWLVTSYVISSNVKEQFPNFGAGGALLFALLTGALLAGLFRRMEGQTLGSTS